MESIVVVPAIKVCGLGEIGIAAEQDAAEASTETDLPTAISFLGSPFSADAFGEWLGRQ